MDEIVRPKLGDIVEITCSGERGQVIGRAEYLNAEPNNFVRYQNSLGTATEQWWPDSAVTVAP